MRLCSLILLLWVASSTQLYSQEAVSAAIVHPKIKPPASEQPVLVQELPYCELGYGPCGGECSSDEGKKKWACAPDAMPCHHEGQRCTCEAAALCKPKKKRSEPAQ